MSERPEIAQITACAVIGALCGGAITAASIVIALSFFGDLPELFLSMILAALFGMILSIFTSWPLGTIVGWLVARGLGVRPSSAAIAGLVTALVMYAGAIGNEVLQASFDPTDGYWVAWFCLIGVLSGLLGYRVTMGPLLKRNRPTN